MKRSVIEIKQLALSSCSARKTFQNHWFVYCVPKILLTGGNDVKFPKVVISSRQTNLNLYSYVVFIVSESKMKSCLLCPLWLYCLRRAEELKGINDLFFLGLLHNMAFIDKWPFRLLPHLYTISVLNSNENICQSLLKFVAA